MIHNLREAFNDLLNENDWMDESTRKVARVKVGQIIYMYLIEALMVLLVKW